MEKDNKLLSNIIQEYRKSQIQSEAEVRSKLIVPLLMCLGYPSELRSEEFPVYGFEGRKPLPAKCADFLLFSDTAFSTHRSFTQKDNEWVQDHSLLVFEAKKPGHLPDILGQPVYYTIWTRAVAYLVSDGEIIIGYFYNPITSDRELVNCKIDELPDSDAIWNFSFDNLLSIKNRAIDKSSFSLSQNTDSLPNTRETIFSDDEINLPDETLNYIRYALGRNSENLKPSALLSRFLNMTDCYLQNQIRYDIPKYMFDIPRQINDAYLYIDNLVMPIDKGEVWYYFWNEYERYHYKSKYFEIHIIYYNEKLYDFEIGFHVLDTRVSDRLINFEKVKNCLLSKTAIISIQNETPKNVCLPSGKPKKMWKSKSHNLAMLEYWTENLEKLLAIEKYYEIQFSLQYIEGEDNLINLYTAIDNVYDGISMNNNCFITLSGGHFDDNIEINEPFLFQENTNISLPKEVIHNYTFQPYKSYILPGIICTKGTTSDDIIEVSACCQYIIESSH